MSVCVLFVLFYVTVKGRELHIGKISGFADFYFMFYIRFGYKEAVQVYISEITKKVFRLNKELNAYKKVLVKAHESVVLEPILDKSALFGCLPVRSFD